ncbi:hypothetical protein BH11MYX1_BH11MYX1_15370 [soil metagenome]
MLVSTIVFSLALTAAACDGVGATPQDGATPRDADADATAVPPDAPTVVPLGQRYLVGVLFGGAPNAYWTRLSQITLHDDGTYAETFWRWNQADFSGSSPAKRSSGYTATGCTNVCTVYTPTTFVSEPDGVATTGTWAVSSAAGRIIVRRPDIDTTWSLTDTTRYTRYDLFNESSDGIEGWMWSSTQPFTKAADFDTIYGDGNNSFAEEKVTSAFEDHWTRVTSGRFYMSTFQRCSTSPAMENRRMPGQALDTYYRILFAGDPAVDGRKTFFNHERGSVAFPEDPTSQCTTQNSGHNGALLQLIDDDGVFFGWAEAESSYTGINHNGGNIVAAGYWLRKNYVPPGP